MVEMIKKLFFTAALVVPSLAYAGNPSADLAVQIVPAGSAVPAPAQAAGFTTLALNADFTQPFYATPSNWLACAGATNPQWWIGGAQTDGAHPPPCSAIRQANDPSTGQPVLDMTWLPSYQVGNTAMTEIWTVNQAPGTTRGTMYPFGYYEAVARIVPMTNNTPDNQYFGFWTNDASNGSAGGIEYDAIETRQNGVTDSCIHNWGQGGAGNCLWIGTPPPEVAGGYDATQYHKYAMRITGDGGKAIWMCNYVDDVFQGCVQANASGSQLTGQRNIPQLAVGAMSNNPGLPNTRFRQDLYVKSVRVWSCSDWQGSFCPSSSANP